MTNRDFRAGYGWQQKHESHSGMPSAATTRGIKITPQARIEIFPSGRHHTFPAVDLSKVGIFPGLNDIPKPTPPSFEEVVRMQSERKGIQSTLSEILNNNYIKTREDLEIIRSDIEKYGTTEQKEIFKNFENIFNKNDKKNNGPKRGKNSAKREQRKPFKGLHVQVPETNEYVPPTSNEQNVINNLNKQGKQTIADVIPAETKEQLGELKSGTPNQRNKRKNECSVRNSSVQANADRKHAEFVQQALTEKLNNANTREELEALEKEVNTHGTKKQRKLFEQKMKMFAGPKVLPVSPNITPLTNIEPQKPQNPNCNSHNVPKPVRQKGKSTLFNVLNSRGRKVAAIIGACFIVGIIADILSSKSKKVSSCAVQASLTTKSNNKPQNASFINKTEEGTASQTNVEQAETTQPAENSALYTVQTGDSIWSIAENLLRDSEIPVKNSSILKLSRDIRELNKIMLNDDNYTAIILPGQSLRLPKNLSNLA